MDGRAGAPDLNRVGGADPPRPTQEFAVSLRNRVSAIHEVPPPRSFTFLSDACRGLEQARKVVGAGAGGMYQGVLAGPAAGL